MNNWTRLLHALGVTEREFDMEQMRFMLSPTRWFEARLAALGWVRAADIPPPEPCPRTCCLSDSKTLQRP